MRPAEASAAEPDSFTPRFRRWARNGVPVLEDGAAGLAAALPSNVPRDIFVIVPASNIDGLTSVARRDALEVAEAFAMLRSPRRMRRLFELCSWLMANSVALNAVIGQPFFAHISAFRKRRLRRFFFSRSMIRAKRNDHDVGRRLWTGKVVVSSSRLEDNPGDGQQQTVSHRAIPGFELVMPGAVRKNSERRLLELLPVTAKKQASVSARVLTVVPPALPVGGFLSAQKELELHITDECNATTGHFCDGWVRSGACLLLRIENLTMLCVWKGQTDSKHSPWVCDVAPVYELSTSTMLALDSASYRKYVLGICGRSGVSFPCKALASLPLISISVSAEKGNICADDSPGTKWIDKEAFKDAIAVLSRTKSKDVKAKKVGEGAAEKPLKRRSESGLREPPSWDEVPLFERDAMKRKEVSRAETERKRARSGNFSLDNLTDSALPWTARSNLSEDFNISTGAHSSKEQISTLRQNRQARLQSMQSARNIAVRQDQGGARNDWSWRTSLRSQVKSSRAGTGKSFNRNANAHFTSSRSRARSLGSNDWHHLIAKIQDTTILPKLERSENFFDFSKGAPCSRVKSESEDRSLQRRGELVGLQREIADEVQDRPHDAMEHGVEYARDGVDIRDVLLTKYGFEVGRSAQEYATAWSTMGTKEGFRKLQSAVRNIEGIRDAQKQVVEQAVLIEPRSNATCWDADDGDAVIALWGRGRARRMVAKSDIHEGDSRDGVLGISTSTPSDGLDDVKELAERLVKLEQKREELDEDISRLRARLSLRTQPSDSVECVVK